ncbi:MAG: undecaprenyl/decaprenyl-phosphate alpha-N-acetylglucosaminyl 1-phosphate transferase [Bacillaceae bacterium]|nr:undecaprenyl/decaprenyl-phosphate alpha-N-acetylglucosaminyl 1-phosphate transferase [Bacillaceae bacterium]
MSTYVLGFFISLVITVMATPGVMKLAKKIGAVDYPDGKRKVHNKVMPRLGGLAIYIGFVISYLVVFPSFSALYAKEAAGILVGSTIILFVGIIDDKYQLSPKMKFLGQLVAAIVVVMFGLRMPLINLPFDGQLVFSEWISILATVIWIVAVTNAINLIDGLDGLAAGVSGIATATMMVIAVLMGNFVVALYSLVLLGAIIGFLFFNFHPAKIFMGDAGALFLGFNLAALSVLGFKFVTFIAFITPLLILGVPLSDTFFAIIRRIVNKKPISQADKNHLHHCLLNMGFSHRQTVLIIYGISVIFGTISVLFYQNYDTLWAAMIILGVVIIALQLGAEITGLVSKTKRPLIDLYRSARIYFNMFK